VRLTDDLRRHAAVAGNGEPLWPLAMVAEVIGHHAGSGLGLLGVEVYGRVAEARGSFQREWTPATGWADHESWADFVERAAADALGWLAAEPDHDQRYFVAVVTADEYPRPRVST
jgi:hypothetical protein